jgi:hypothetical protein
VLIGLIIAGLVNAILFSFFIAIGAGIAFFLLPLMLDTGTIVSILLSVFMIRPHEHVPRGIRKGSGSNNQPPPNQNQQNPSAPPSSPQTVVIQPQNVIIQTQNVGYQNKPSGSPTTYI